jgi:hypothetical protein
MHKERFIVIRSGQLVQHGREEEATREAIRLINKTGDSFYVAKIIKVGSPAEVIFEPYPNVSESDIKPGSEYVKLYAQLLGHPQNRYGRLWPESHNQLLIWLWNTCDFTIEGLAKLFGRSHESIRCKLASYGLGPYA